MFKRIKRRGGFTMVEVLFVSALFLVAVLAIMATWRFAAGTLTAEDHRSRMRVDILKALETMKHDLRMTNLSYVVFYPDSGEPYTGISLPLATADSNGFFPLDSEDDIDWDRTVIYHLYTDGGGVSSLRRTTLFDRDNALTREERYEELTDVVTAGQGSGSYSTDADLVENVDAFEITNLSSVVDFYEDSAEPVRVGKVVFGMARMSPGTHTFRFEITGKNEDSSGYGIGIDQIMIEPCGSEREAEYYLSPFAPSGALTLSGGTANRVYSVMWSNNNYLEFDANADGDYIEITDDYDLWRESVFNNASLNNATSFGEEARIGLDIQEDDLDQGVFAWDAGAQVEDSLSGGRDGDFPGGSGAPVVIRNIVQSYNIDNEGDMVRICFRASSANDLSIARAYLTERQGASAHGEANQDPSGLEIEEFHRHQQLFFNDISGNAAQGITIPAGEETWSVWTAFPLKSDKDYLVTMEIRDPSSVDCRYWTGTSAATQSYFLVGSAYSSVGGEPDWSSYAPSASTSVFITSKIDSRQDSGTVESAIFDTTATGPVYDEARWSEAVPAGTDVKLKARSSDSSTMSGATTWDLLTGSGANPTALSIGSGRYAQFQAELSSEPFWKVGAATLAYRDYIDQQVDGAVDAFPASGGTPYVTGIYSTWVDDVEMNWDGGERLVNITGYIARKDDYGQAKLLLDGQELVRVLRVRLRLERDIQGREIAEENFIEVYPRNTGK